MKIQHRWIIGRSKYDEDQDERCARCYMPRTDRNEESDCTGRPEPIVVDAPAFFCVSG